MTIGERFGIPCCPDTSLRLPVGVWEYRREADAAAITTLVAAGWVVRSSSADGALLKYTHREAIQ